MLSRDSWAKLFLFTVERFVGKTSGCFERDNHIFKTVRGIIAVEFTGTTKLFVRKKIPLPIVGPLQTVIFQ